MNVFVKQQQQQQIREESIVGYFRLWILIVHIVSEDLCGFSLPFYHYQGRKFWNTTHEQCSLH